MVHLIAGLTLLLGGLHADVKAPPPKKEPAKKPGVLHVHDGGSLFTGTAIDKAKVAMGKTLFEHETALTIDTHSTVPKDRKLPDGVGERARFFEDWAKASAATDRAKGVYVLVCRSPGYVQVIVDKATLDRGFTNENEQRVRDMLITAFRDSAKETDDKKKFELRDKALAGAVDYVSGALKGTVK